MMSILEPEEGLETLGEINRLTQLNDDSGIIEPQLISYLDSLGNSAYDMSCLRVTGQTLPGEVLTGLGEDERVAEVLRRNIQDFVVLPGMSEGKALQTRAAQVVAVRLLCIITRVGAVELRNAVAQQCLASQTPPIMRVVLTLTVDILDAAGLGTHPGGMMHVILDYTDQVLWLADDDLNAYFTEPEMIVQQREKDLELGRFGGPGAARSG